MGKKRTRVLRRGGKKKDTGSAGTATVDPGVVRLVGETKTVAIGKVRPNGFNYNRQSPFIYEKMLTSLREYGFVDPIIVRSGDEGSDFDYYEIIGGEHRWKAAAELGYTEVLVQDLGRMADVRAKKLCIILNETKGKPDNDALASLIADLSEEVGMEGLGVLPFAEDEIDAFISMSNEDWGNVGGGLGEDSLGDDSGGGADKKTIIAVMGLLEISKRKESILIDQFEEALRLMALEGKPVLAFERMLNKIVKHYRKKAQDAEEE